MNREALAHALRAAASVVNEDQFLVIGSAAILGSYPARLLPAQHQMSEEVDLVCAFDDGDTKADQLDGSLGELSLFHETHGFAIDGVSISTAVVPSDWAGRVRPFAPVDANGAIGWCLHPIDLVISKAMAHRPKDISFIRNVAKNRLVDISDALDRIPLAPVMPTKRQAAEALLTQFERTTPGIMKEELDISGRADLPPFDASAFGYSLALPANEPELDLGL